MQTDPLLCGIDAGTSRIRAIVFEPDGRPVAEGARPTPIRHLAPGQAEHDAQALWHATLEALRDALAGTDRPSRIRGLAVASVGEAGVLLDARGEPMAPVMAWYDTRPATDLEAFYARIDAARLHAITGLCPDPTFTLPKLLWLKANAPQILARAEAWQSISGWLSARLCGAQAMDFSLASRTLALDLEGRSWSREILEAAGIDAALFGAPAPAGTCLGRLLPDIAAATGLDPGCVVAVAGHDHLCGLLAVDADAPGVLMNSLGTAEALILVVDRPHTDPALGKAGFHQGTIEVDRPLFYVFGGLPTSAAAVEWFRHGPGGGADHGTLTAEADAAAAAGHEVMFLPHLRLGSPPHPDPIGRGAFLGLSDGCDRGALFRAVLEGVALDGAHQIEALKGLGFPAPQRVVAIGGGSRNRLFVQLKADLFGLPVETLEMPEATALGAALLGGLAAGLYPDLATARRGLAVPRQRTLPSMPPDRRAARLATYAAAYEGLRSLHRRLRQDR